MDDNLLSIKDLKIGFSSEQGLAYAVDGVNFTMPRGSTFALLGESGCGKSMTALSILQLLPAAAVIESSSQIIYQQQELLALPEVQMRSVRGHKIGMIFQEPMTSLNPVLTVGVQIGEVLSCHFGLSGRAKRERILELLNAVGIPDVKRRYHEYPHQLSGGLKQRVMIAMALAGEPELLVADEPTTALDVTIQSQVLTLLKDLQRQTNMGILLITHDLGVVKQMADNVGVMYAGHIVEQASAEDFFRQPYHPYSQKLFASLPSMQKRDEALSIIKGSVPPLTAALPACRFADRCPLAWQTCRDVKPAYLSKEHGRRVRCHLYDDNITKKTVPEEIIRQKKLEPANKTISPVTLELEDFKVHFPIHKGIFKRTVGYVKAVDGVELALSSGKTLAIVGESGCGKTTLGLGILQLEAATGGSVQFDSLRLDALSARALHKVRRDVQIIFQDPYSSMNPRMLVGDILAEGMIAHGIEKKSSARDKRIDELLNLVGLPRESKHRYPHEFSGGQRQRICIARTLAVKPKIIICDEPTSALDVSVQAQILNLLKQLQAELGVAYLFITHNISVVGYLADEVAVMYLGRIVERGPVDEILQAPKHPYTQALLSAVPVIDEAQREVIKLEGEQPSPVNPPIGCHFNPRCSHAMDICRRFYPGTTDLPQQHQVKCFLHGNKKYVAA